MPSFDKPQVLSKSNVIVLLVPSRKKHYVIWHSKTSIESKLHHIRQYCACFKCYPCRSIAGRKKRDNKKYTTSINNLSTTICKLKTIRLLKLHIVNHTSSYLNENPHTSYLVEEFRFNDAIQLLEAPPDPFPGPRPMYAISVGLSGSGNILLKDLGRADGIDALLTICKNISQKIVTHIDQIDFFFFFFLITE